MIRGDRTLLLLAAFLASPADASAADLPTRLAAIEAATSVAAVSSTRPTQTTFTTDRLGVPVVVAVLTQYAANGTLDGATFERRLEQRGGRVHANPRDPNQPRTPTLELVADPLTSDAAAGGQPHLVVTTAADAALTIKSLAAGPRVALGTASSLAAHWEPFDTGLSAADELAQLGLAGAVRGVFGTASGLCDATARIHETATGFRVELRPEAPCREVATPGALLLDLGVILWAGDAPASATITKDAASDPAAGLTICRVDFVPPTPAGVAIAAAGVQSFACGATSQPLDFRPLSPGWPLFADGFASGGTSAWSTTVGAGSMPAASARDAAGRVLEEALQQASRNHIQKQEAKGFIEGELQGARRAGGLPGSIAEGAGSGDCVATAELGCDRGSTRLGDVEEPGALAAPALGTEFVRGHERAVTERTENGAVARYQVHSCGDLEQRLRTLGPDADVSCKHGNGFARVYGDPDASLQTLDTMTAAALAGASQTWTTQQVTMQRAAIDAVLSRLQVTNTSNYPTSTLCTTNGDAVLCSTQKEEHTYQGAWPGTAISYIRWSARARQVVGPTSGPVYVVELCYNPRSGDVNATGDHLTSITLNNGGSNPSVSNSSNQPYCDTRVASWAKTLLDNAVVTSGADEKLTEDLMEMLAITVGQSSGTAYSTKNRVSRNTAADEYRIDTTGLVTSIGNAVWQVNASFTGGLLDDNTLMAIKTGDPGHTFTPDTFEVDIHELTAPYIVWSTIFSQVYVSPFGSLLSNVLPIASVYNGHDQNRR